MKRVKRRADPKNIQIFDWCVIKGIPPAKVAHDFHVTRARVYLAKQRIGEMLKREIEDLRRRLE